MKALVFGAGGGIGSALCNQLRLQGHLVTAIGRNELDCSTDLVEDKVSAIIDLAQPDWIFNCIGVLGSNQDNYRDIFDANFGSNWAIVKHYLENTAAKVQIVLVGSTVHNQPRRNSILYAASKSALHNLWQSTEDIFVGTNVNIGLVHPPRVDTKMLNGRLGPSLSPDYVAQVMIDLTNTMKSRTLLEIGI